MTERQAILELRKTFPTEYISIEKNFCSYEYEPSKVVTGYFLFVYTKASSIGGGVGVSSKILQDGISKLILEVSNYQEGGILK